LTVKLVIDARRSSIFIKGGGFSMRKVCLAAGTLVACLLPFPASPSSADVPRTGLIVSVSGDVSVLRGGNSELATEGFVLQPGDTLLAKWESECTGFGLGGERFVLEGPSQLVLDASPETGTLDRVSAWVSRQICEWSGKRRRQAILSRKGRDWGGEFDVPSLLIPAPEGKVRGKRSTFVWAAIGSAGSYTITIAPEDGEEFIQTVRGHSLVRQDLEPGASYAWRVFAEGPGGRLTSGWRSFSVMEAEEERRLDEALQGMGDLEAGVLLLSSGLHQEAIHRLDAAVSSGKNMTSARRWRAEALADVGLYKEAYTDLLEATAVQ
jgi:hypothetical protein